MNSSLFFGFSLKSVAVCGIIPMIAIECHQLNIYDYDRVPYYGVVGGVKLHREQRLVESCRKALAEFRPASFL